ncbi:MAG: hypothetical protein KGO02_24980 [Alphaproteobacteria bacterium]|nr:hypothetical protein [Alphaproteobacteria bacterium]
MSSYGFLLKQASSVQISHNVHEGDLGFRIGYAGNATTHKCSASPYPHRCMFVAFSHPVDDLDGTPAATCSAFTEERDQHGGAARHPHPYAMLGADN